jgi:hypothetical protein
MKGMGNLRRPLVRGGALLCLLLSISAFSKSPASIPTFAIHNFLPEFWQFWDAAHDQPLDTQMQLWQDLYVKPHQAVFDDLAIPCKPEFDAGWAKTEYFPNLPTIVPAMRVISDRLQQQLGPANERFLRMFPDMHWAGDIYVMASGYCFRGRAQVIQGRSALLFGVDTIADMKQGDLVPGIHHELFHRYHHQFFDFEPSSGYPLWTALWAEGMAVYVSEQLTPSAGELDLSMVPLGMVQQVDRRQSELAADFLKRFDSTAEKDATVYFNDDNSKDPFVPARAGYELGVLVARRLAAHYTLQAMAHWSQQEAKPKIREALVAIANSAHK